MLIENENMNEAIVRVKKESIRSQLMDVYFHEMSAKEMLEILEFLKGKYE